MPGAWLVERLSRVVSPTHSTNIRIVCDTSSEVGGNVGMLMAWGWNIRGQGVYRDEGSFSYLDKDDLINRVSASLVNRRGHSVGPLGESSQAADLWVSQRRALAST